MLTFVWSPMVQQMAMAHTPYASFLDTAWTVHVFPPSPVGVAPAASPHHDHPLHPVRNESDGHVTEADPPGDDRTDFMA